jgi:endonuclease-3 related protein
VTGTAQRIRLAYERLLSTFGPQDWWPGGGPFEVMAGAVLTQNTSWRNAERALTLMREAGALEQPVVSRLPLSEIERLVRPAGAWRRKARTVAALARAAGDGEGALERFLSRGTDELRESLLAVPGVGPETADAILLYACERPVFVVDAYTRRLLERHGIAAARTRYDEIRTLFERALERDRAALAECHALLVELGKCHCRPTPACAGCPLEYDLQTK